MDKWKKMYRDLPIRKKLAGTFFYGGAILLFVILIGLVGFINLNGKLDQFYRGPYEMSNSVQSAQIALQRIENHINRAYMAKQQDTVKKYIGMAEECHEELVKYIETMVQYEKVFSDQQATKIVSSLNTEMEKGQRYRKKIKESGMYGNQEEIYSVFKNDYAPILDHMSEELDKMRGISDKNAHQFIEEARQSTVISFGIFGILLIVGVVGIISIVKIVLESIITPVEEIKKAMEQMAAGDLSVKLEFRGNDELGSLCVAISSTIHQLRTYVNNVTVVLDNLASKNMTVHPGTEYKGDFLPMQKALEGIVQYLNDMLYQIRNIGMEVHRGAEQIASLSQEVSTEAEKQWKSIQLLRDRICAIVGQVSKNNENAKAVSILSLDTEKKALEGSVSMKHLVGSMSSISEHTGRIANIMDIINDIAEQTRLLSLNASIEAASAGEFGKGFAVVAEEMRKLANRCTEATKSTEQLIGGSVVAMEEVVQVAESTQEKFQIIVEATTKMRDSVEPIYEESNRERNHLEEILKFTEQIAGIVEGNSASARESLATSEEFLSQAEMLGELLNQFQLRG